MWIPSWDNASSAGTATAGGQIGVGKADPIRRQTIDIRRTNALISVTPEIIPANVISNEKYEVRFPMADEKREIEIKETKLKRGFLMECKEMAHNTLKPMIVLSLRNLPLTRIYRQLVRNRRFPRYL